MMVWDAMADRAVQRASATNLIDNDIAEVAELTARILRKAGEEARAKRMDVVAREQWVGIGNDCRALFFDESDA